MNRLHMNVAEGTILNNWWTIQREWIYSLEYTATYSVLHGFEYRDWTPGFESQRKLSGKNFIILDFQLVFI